MSTAIPSSTPSRTSGRPSRPPRTCCPSSSWPSHLLGADRAVSNFGGGNTSAKGTAVDHVGREVPVMWVKGSGSDLATMGPEHFTGLRLDEVLPLIDRAEMSDEDMVAHLSRCQLDPRMPRCSIETLLHAFVPAPTSTTRTPTASTSWPARRTASASCRRRSATRPFGSPTSARASRSPSRSVRRPAPTPTSGSWCSPSTASSSGATPPRRPTAHHRGDQPGRRVRQRAHRPRAALRRSPSGGGAGLRRRAREQRCGSCCPPCAAPSPASATSC